MLSLIEDISDSLNKESKMNQKKGQSVDIAFMDISEISATAQVLYLVGILSAMVGLFYVFYTKANASEQVEIDRQRKVDEKKNKK